MLQLIYSSINAHSIHEISDCTQGEYEDTESYKVTKMFINNREIFHARLLSKKGETSV